MVDIDVLFGYLVTNVSKEIFMDNSRQYGNGLVKFEPNDLNKGKAVDLRLLTEEEAQLVSAASQRLLCQGIEDEIILLLDSFFREKFTDRSVCLAYYWGQLHDLGHPDSNPIEESTLPTHAKQLIFPNLFSYTAQDNAAEALAVHEDET